MKYILCSKSRFVRFNMHSKSCIADISYTFIDFQEVLNNESKNADFLDELLTDMESGNGLFTEKRKRYIWSSILTNSFDSDYVFVSINYPKFIFDTLIEVAKELKIEFEAAINLYLNKELIIKEAKNFLKTYESEAPTSEEENIQILLSDEQERLSLINEIQKMVKVINIESDCSQNEIENKILKEIEIGFNNI